MNSKITKKYCIEIFQKTTRTTNSSFRIFFLVMAKFAAVIPLLNSEAFLQKKQNFTIALDSFRVNIYETSLIVNFVHNAKKFGGFTMAIYSILKMYLNQGYKCMGIIGFITNQEAISDFFKKSINDIEEMALLYRLKVLQLKYTAHYNHIS